MSWRDAPLYVEAAALARTVGERATVWTGASPLAGTTLEVALSLVDAVALALTFPETRAAHLEAADHAVVRLRERLRLAGALGLLSPGALRHATGRLQLIGRMIGGWRRRRGPQARDPPEAQELP